MFGIDFWCLNNLSLEGLCIYKLGLVYNLKFKVIYIMCIDYIKVNFFGNYGYVWK